MSSPSAIELRDRRTDAPASPSFNAAPSSSSALPSLSSLSLHSSSPPAPAAAAPRAAFRPTKQLGENVVVLRHLSKRYKLAGRGGGADGAASEEEVVALRHVNLIPL